MRCKAGDLALIIKSNLISNRMLPVTVDVYIGYMNEGDKFEYNGINCVAPVSDHYWWISSKYGLETPYGPTTKAYSPDTWLLPIRPDLLSDSEETGEEIYGKKVKKGDAPKDAVKPKETVEV